MKFIRAFCIGIIGIGLVLCAGTARAVLPIPEGGSVIPGRTLNGVVNGMNLESEACKAPLSMEEAKTFYKDTLSGLGWQSVDTAETENLLIFTKPAEKENMSLVFQNQAEEGFVYIFASIYHGELRNPAKPGEDTPGEDLPGIPRYPRSVRMVSFNMAFMKNVGYRSFDRKEEIMDFYAANMPRYGWKRFDVTKQVKEKAKAMSGLPWQMMSDGSFILFENKESICGIITAVSPKDDRSVRIGILVMPKKRK